MTDAATPDPDARLWQLVRYFHDCLAAQTDWTRAINVIDQRDLTLFPLAATEQQELGAIGELRLVDESATDLAKRVAISGENMSLFLGALFLVGSIRSQEDQTEKRFCAPLLEVPVSLREESGEVVVAPEEAEFTINYSLVGELLAGDTEDLQDRLAELGESVPDFPIDATEFEEFWNRFRLVAPEVVISDQPPDARKTKDSTNRLDARPANDPSTPQGDPHARGIEMVDFYIPRIPKDGPFRLLPATALVFGPKVGRTLSALSELRAMTDMALSRTAFGCLFAPESAPSTVGYTAERNFPDELYPIGLSPTQQEIVESSRSAPLTVVTGPPGTGKSYTITAIVLDALLRGETVLVASQMDKAVEVVADQVESIAGRLAIARSGGRAAQRHLAKKISQLTGPRSGLDSVADESIDQCEKQHYDLSRELQNLEQSFGKTVEAERKWSEAFQARQRSLPLFPNPPAEVPDDDVRKAEKLLQRASGRLSGDPGRIRRWLANWDLSRATGLLGKSDDTTPSLEELWGLLTFQLLQVTMHEVERSLTTPLPAEQLWKVIEEVERRRREEAVRLLQLLRQKRMRSLVSDQQHRSALRDLALLLRRRKEEVKLQLQENLSAELLLDAFPAWASTSRSLCEILPATPRLFDLVIIDEASQCDLALASVALMRGKRAVVVGDPNQLRHVCFLSKTREQASFARNGIPADMQQRFHYRRSLFDVAADMVKSRNFYFLNEHFRSHPQIIEFSNRKFYEESLSIMTGRPSEDPQIAIHTRLVEGCRETGSSINPAEIDAVMETVASVIASDQHASIGIVSPFRDHADAIKERLMREQPAEVLARHRMVVGTAHSLQGDEKDVVVLSTSIDEGAHPASLRFLESPNLFNVAITRARRQLIIVTSMSADNLPVGLLREFLVHAERGWSAGDLKQDTDCAIEQTITERLQQDQLSCWTGFQSAGTRIDVVAIDGGKSLAILCDREESSDWRKSLEGQRRLSRADWPITRIPHRAVQVHWDACRRNILDHLR